MKLIARMSRQRTTSGYSRAYFFADRTDLQTLNVTVGQFKREQ